MPAYSNRSVTELSTCDRKLVQLFQRVLSSGFDHTIVDGIRTLEQQRKNVVAGLSQTMDSKHLPNSRTGLSDAVDVIPFFPNFDWDHTPPVPSDFNLFSVQQIFFAGYVLGIAAMSKDILGGSTIRYGGDWNQNHDLRDNHFNDLDHFELHDS